MRLEGIDHTPGQDSRQGSDPAEAARKLEALFLSLLVREMRQSVPGEGLFGSGPGAAIYEGFFDTMMAEELARGEGTGLRQAILESWGEPAEKPLQSHMVEAGAPSEAAASSEKKEVSRNAKAGVLPKAPEIER